jgi:hypothetical protein
MKNILTGINKEATNGPYPPKIRPPITICFDPLYAKAFKSSIIFETLFRPGPIFSGPAFL